MRCPEADSTLRGVKLFAGLQIVQRDGKYWVSYEGGKWIRSGGADLRHHVRELCDLPELPRSADLEEISRPLLKLEASYLEPTRFDAATQTLIEGLDIPPIEPRESPRVRAWLAALAGDKLEHLEMWIAACRQDRLSMPARALMILGPKDCGKGAFAHGLARAFGTTPVNARVVCDRFNGDLTRCPIVFADEELPHNMSGENFREYQSARSFTIERKGLERSSLQGAIRLVLACNDAIKMRLAGSKGSGDADAIGDRLCIVDIGPRGAETREALRQLHTDEYGSNVDLDEIAAHFVYLMHTVTPASGRFIGAPASAEATNFTLRAEIAKVDGLEALLRDYAAERKSTEAQYTAPTSQDAVFRRDSPNDNARSAYPLIVYKGALCCRTQIIASVLGIEAGLIRSALKPFTVGEETCKFGIDKHRYARLDAAKLGAALGVEFDLTYDTTRKR